MSTFTVSDVWFKIFRDHTITIQTNDINKGLIDLSPLFTVYAN